MGDHRPLVAAVALMCATGCGANDDDSRDVVRTTAQSSQGNPGDGSTPGAAGLVLASMEGVDLIAGKRDPVRLSHQPAAVAYGARDAAG